MQQKTAIAVPASRMLLHSEQVAELVIAVASTAHTDHRTPGSVMITLNLNGSPRKLDLPDDMPLLWALRDVLGMMGTKFGCGLGLCGACTVHVDGAMTRSCITSLGSVVSKSITTIEGVGRTPAGAAVQRAWLANDVPQCGYCQSGQIMAATALLAKNRDPSDADIDDAMSGNICRCGTYVRIREAIKQASKANA